MTKTLSPKVSFTLAILFGSLSAYFVHLFLSYKPSPFEEPMPSIPEKVDTFSLKGKLLAGYTGFYNTRRGDSSTRWSHWSYNHNQPASDKALANAIWPDLSELDAKFHYPTGLLKTNGTPASFTSALDPQTVDLHFEWMQTYKIDGIFLHRYPRSFAAQDNRNDVDTVLSNVRGSAARFGRVYALLYDLDELNKGGIEQIREDWWRLSNSKGLTKDQAYLKHEGKPLVALRGITLDPHNFTLEQLHQLVLFFKQQGCTLSLGPPSDWRTMIRDHTAGPALKEILELANIINPWTPADFTTHDEATRQGKDPWPDDLIWCEQRGIDFLPSVFPGYRNGSFQDEKRNHISRNHGKFLYAQLQSILAAGSQMVYLESLDDYLNGTSLLKVSKELPLLSQEFPIEREDLPSDYYLKTTHRAWSKFKRTTLAPKSIPTP